MKKNKTWLWILLGSGAALITAIILILSLGGRHSLSDSEQVKQVAKNFLTSFNNMKWDKAKQYATPESAEQIDAYASIADDLLRNTPIPEFYVEITSVTINYDVYPMEATTNYTLTNEVSGTESAALRLKKIDGKWLVVYEKEGPEDDGNYEYDESTDYDDDDETFVAVENMPEFPGGEAALYKYLTKNLKYPDIAREQNIQGKVYVQFIVEKDGSITDPKAIRDIGGGCGDEAVRVVSGMPKWKPGNQRGRNVRVQFTLPVAFQLE